MDKKLVFAALLMVASGAALAETPSQPPEGHEFGKRQEFNHPVTRDEALKRAGEHFDRADTNHDGVLSKEEREAAHQKMRENREERRERRNERQSDRQAAPH